MIGCPPSIQVIAQLADVVGTDADELMALAGKAPPGLGKTLKDSAAARAFFRSARDMNLTEEQWQDLLKKLQKHQGQ